MVINHISSPLREDFRKRGFVYREDSSDFLDGCRIHFLGSYGIRIKTGSLNGIVVV